MATFKAGFGRVTITPPLGVKMAGYYHERISEGVLDELEANCLAVNDGENTAVLLSCDLLYCNQPQIDYTRDLINSTTGVPIDNIFICCTHTHTGPYCLRGSCISSPVATHDTSRADPAYLDMLSRKMATAAQLAINDLAETTADIGRNTVHDVAFIRRFLMKDGSAKPFPGFNHPDIVRPIGEPDETVQVLRFNREGKKSITVVNLQVHADMVGFEKFSADYPRYVRETVETVYPDTHCIYYNGPEGDLGGVDPYGDPILYDKFSAIDRLRRAKHAGRCIAGGVMQIYEKLTPVELGTIKGMHKVVSVPTARVTDPDKIAEAERVWAIHEAGGDDQFPMKGMDRIAYLAEAGRITKLKDGPDSFDITVYGISFGEVAFAGFPGEPFTTVGQNTKARAPYAMTIPCALTNGADGYFPDEEAYRGGGYENAASVFACGVAEALTDAAVEILEDLKK
ncbi:MAG: hypothetical protein IJC52_01990 [Clostridia bacterium]|nr:hypothetical protein [Clostridia bacterium]